MKDTFTPKIDKTIRSRYRELLIEDWDYPHLKRLLEFLEQQLFLDR